MKDKKSIFERLFVDETDKCKSSEEVLTKNPWWLLEDGLGNDKGPIMPFGQYRGSCIFKIADISHLCWLLKKKYLKNIGIVKAIEGQILYLSKISDKNSEDYDIVYEYINYVDQHGHNKQSKDLKQKCVYELVEKYYENCKEETLQSKIDYHRLYNNPRVSRRTMRRRYRSV
jgi:hypothetical protein